ncbi:sporulation protein YabP [Thermanaeromonas toyohensis ToBE]|uniref:Sporulation protein YabP n=1 Tax=Thermanaeromonas toyohensis ToBE TaxID=698762 RepID=A0A1W1V7T9_9FIRM|nr:YabP/YqfC family sporulation protein [Thermanaeromonas toyohensis]SMB89489.1 sporulation protein YabP [Thermanaeromonas toyohensis ToBE]
MGEGQHRVEVFERQNICVSGVVQVMGYDEEEIILETTCGLLILKGKNFNISSLSLESGTLEASGFLHSLDYREEGTAKKSFLRRILK